MKPVLSIITGTRNRLPELRLLIRSVNLYTDVPYEMIIADASDAPIDESGFPEAVVVIPERPRLGYALGLNIACGAAQGDWTLILNDDCEVTPGYASAAVNFMRKNPQIGLGALPYSNKGGPFMVNTHEGMVYGNFSILPTALGNQIGWHDTDLVMYGADNALSYKVLLAGYGIAEIPNARVLHHETQDAHRVEYNRDRQTPVAIIESKYLPRLAEMRRVYEQARMQLVA